MAECKKCKAEIVFAKTKEGKWMPLNVKLQNFVVLDEDQVAHVKAGHIPHWATCPFADEFRKPSPQLSLLPKEDPS